MKSKLVKMDIESIDIFRKAEPEDIKEGNMVFLVGDGNLMHRFMVDEVLRPDDDFKAFVADDGCWYGLMNLYVLKSHNNLLAQIRILSTRLKSIKELAKS